MSFPSVDIFIDWREWGRAISARLGPIVSRAELPPEPVALVAFSKTALPAAGKHKQILIYVTDEAGGAVPAFSDGTNWRRVTDRAIVS